MESTPIKAKSIKRIHRDLKEIESFPIEGLGVCIPDESNPFELRANIQILDGIYQGMMLHLIMNIPENYPTKAPKMLIAANQGFTNKFHHHVFPDPKSEGHTICIDLLDHGFFTAGEKTGWTPAYTLSTVLMQMQIFFSKDYDLHQLPTTSEIEDLRRNLESFKTQIKVANGEYVIHTFENPFPSICKSTKTTVFSQIADIDKVKKQKSLEKLTCYLTRINPEEGESLLGYPMKLNRDQFGRIHVLPILEILSYEGYMTQLWDNPLKVFDFKRFDQISLRTASGSEYNYWFPIYTNEAMYKKFNQHILNAFSVFEFGIQGKKEFDFELSHIISIFPCLMNKMIVHLQKAVLFESIAAIEAYAHFLRLFIKLMDEYPIIQKIIDRKVAEVLKDSSKRNKKNLGDMGEFLVLLAFSSYSFSNLQIWEVLIIEYISRQFFWVIDKIEKNQFFVKERMEIKKLTFGGFFKKMNEAQMKEFYQASKVSNNLLLFNFCAAGRFLVNKKDFVAKIEKNFGVLEEKEIEEFISETNKFKENVNCYEDLMKIIGLEDLAQNLVSLQYVFKKAWLNSVEQKYNKNYV